MIISDKDATARLNSPLNLINKIRDDKSRNGSAMSLFTGGSNGKSKSFLTPQQEIPSSNSPSNSNQQSIDQSSTFNPFEKKAMVVRGTGESPPVTLSMPQSLPSSEKDSSNITLDRLLESGDSQIKLGLAHDTALKLLNNSLELLTTKLDDLKADKLPSVIAAASKTVESIRKERTEAAKGNKDRDVHYHFYTPTQRSLKDYEIIEVQGMPVDDKSGKGGDSHA